MSVYPGVCGGYGVPGPPGPPGQGDVSWRGQWVSGMYNTGDLVHDGGVIWVALRPGVTTRPPGLFGDWDFVTEQVMSSNPHWVRFDVEEEDATTGVAHPVLTQNAEPGSDLSWYTVGSDFVRILHSGLYVASATIHITLVSDPAVPEPTLRLFQVSMSAQPAAASINTSSGRLWAASLTTPATWLEAGEEISAVFRQDSGVSAMVGYNLAVTQVASPPIGS